MRNGIAELAIVPKTTTGVGVDGEHQHLPAYHLLRVLALWQEYVAVEQGLQVVHYNCLENGEPGAVSPRWKSQRSYGGADVQKWSRRKNTCAEEV